MERVIKLLDDSKLYDDYHIVLFIGTPIGIILSLILTFDDGFDGLNFFVAILFSLMLFIVIKDTNFYQRYDEKLRNSVIVLNADKQKGYNMIVQLRKELNEIVENRDKLSPLKAIYESVFTSRRKYPRLKKLINALEIVEELLKEDVFEENT